MNLVDTTGWVEYFAGGKKADFFEKALEDTDNLLVPAICFYEVFKVLLRECGEDDALAAVARMKQATVVPMNDEIAILAARNSLELKLPMADAVIYTTARMYDAILYSMDADFKGLSHVKYTEK